MAFRTKKISQMDPKGANLASTDLLEISELVSGSYVTKSITGAEIVAGATTGLVPTTRTISTTSPLSGGGDLSANRTLSIATANTTTTGALSSTDWNTFNGKQAPISLTTTGTGAATFVANVLNVPTPAAATFTSLTTTGSSGSSTLTAGVLNVPTYSLSGLGGVPTTRTLTINGTTQDLSADRTFTISTGITIGTTAITSGTVGRVLFEGTGNVVQESANLFWDNTNGRLGIGTSTPSVALDILTTTSTALKIVQSSATNSNGLFVDYSNAGGGNAASQSILRITNSGNSSRLMASFNDLLTISKVGDLSSSGLLSTTNVNSNSINTLGGITMSGSTNPTLTATYSGASNSPALTISQTFSGGAGGTAGIIRVDNRGANPYIYLHNNTTNPFLINANGNVLINTTTDAGYKVDVNGTARVTGNAIVGTSSGLYCIGLMGSTSSSKLQAYTNGGLSPIHSITFGYYTTTFDAQDITFNGPVNSKFFGQSTGNWIIGSTTSYASAQFGIDSTTKGFLPPRMTTTQKNAISSPATGLMVYDTTLSKLCVYTTTWETITSL